MNTELLTLPNQYTFYYTPSKFHLIVMRAWEYELYEKTWIKSCTLSFVCSYCTNTEECVNTYLFSWIFMLCASNFAINYAISLISAEQQILKLGQNWTPLPQFLHSTLFILNPDTNPRVAQKQPQGFYIICVLFFTVGSKSWVYWRHDCRYLQLAIVCVRSL